MNQFLAYLFSSDNPGHVKVVQWMWRLILFGLLGIVLLFSLLSFTNLPSVRQLENPHSELASSIIGSNGELLGRFFTENRVAVPYDSLSPYLVNALISTEDERFFQHSGIDFEALGRVAIKTVLLGNRSSGGASTLSQQLAKLLFTVKPGSGLSRVFQKFKEWIIAVRLERKYTKEEIMAMYLNKASFVNNAFGIKAASETYFNKSPRDLEVQEAAMLIGMLQNPALYNPLRRPELTTKRREIVLKQMVKNGFLAPQAYENLRQKPLGLNFKQETHIDGIATYFRMELAKDLKNILNQEQYRRPDGSAYDIYRDGLKIYTTIDPEMQRLAEKAMVTHMANIQKAFWREWKGKNPWTYDYGSDDDIPVEVRQESLQRMIRSTNRYQVLRDRYLSDLLIPITQATGLEFSEDDHEIERIMQERKTPGTIDKYVQSGLISQALADQYRRVMRHEDFPMLLSRWDQLGDVVRREFSRRVRMQVFTYDAAHNFERDTVMSPLDSIRYHRMFLQTGIVAIDPRSGYVKAWVGGINQKYFQFDHVRTNRQVGSTFKPFVYATAIAQQKLSPCFEVYDTKKTIEAGYGNFHLYRDWSPRNFNNEYSGNLLNLREGLRKSKNTVSVELMKLLGDTEPVRGLIHNMGIDSSARYANGRYRVPKSPSICLGATDLTVMEMAGAYTTFANNGTFNKPLTILRIEDKNGKVIYSGLQEERNAIQPNANYVMVDMLRYAGNITNLKSDVAGKTGTTNDFVDGWFMGLTPSLVVGTWVGAEDRWVHFRSSANGQGARMAKPFFVEFMKLLENSSVADYDPALRFFRPPGDLGIELDCSKYVRGGLNLEPTPTTNSGLKEDMFGDELH